ncbi:MAG: transglycosylase SLT domain-containing protein [Deltaproteobacteria bacterium]|nr:transglycosylase SLT domain-containing protein [Deltaproteobacteria bacterium]
MKYLLLSFFLSLLPLQSTYAESIEIADIPSLISSLKFEKHIEFCGEKVPIENSEVLERFEKELLLSLWDRAQIILWLKRSSRYMPHIEHVLKENGMPEDLKYVPVVESALLPHLGSSKGAMGFWQFIAATGRRYGLVIDKNIDERRNIFASTAAAVLYLRELHEMFKSWTLAVAAYNMGEKGLMSEILEQDTGDYYQLYLPLETQRYVFRILSVKLILANPEKYGFKLSKDDYYTPLEFDQVQITCPHDLPIRIIAKAGNTFFKVIKDLNPEIRGYFLAEGTHNILIPKGASAGFEARYQDFLNKHLTARKEGVYVVKKGDSLSSIAKNFDIPLASLLLWNQLDPQRPIHPGDRLIIYKGN